jgi:hypothetical protein
MPATPCASLVPFSSSSSQQLLLPVPFLVPVEFLVTVQFIAATPCIRLFACHGTAAVTQWHDPCLLFLLLLLLLLLLLCMFSAELQPQDRNLQHYHQQASRHTM